MKMIIYVYTHIICMNSQISLLSTRKKPSIVNQLHFNLNKKPFLRRRNIIHPLYVESKKRKDTNERTHQTETQKTHGCQREGHVHTTIFKMDDQQKPIV